MSFFSKLFARRPNTRQSVARTWTTQLCVEDLEERMVPASIPAAPVFALTAVSQSQINVNWTPAAGASGYAVDEWTGSSWRQIANLNSNYTGLSVTGLSAGSTYYFDLAAYNSAGTDWAASKSVTTQSNTVSVNHPVATSSYSNVSGSLFGANGPVFSDVQQGVAGDCWLLSSLAATAARDPQDIRNMFTYQGSAVENGVTVGLYSVRFFDGSGAAHYVTVDTELPGGGTTYDRPANGVLWVALAEKAYAEANGYRYVTTGNVGSDSYTALNEGDPAWALQAITGKSAHDYAVNPSNIVSAWNAGDIIVLISSSHPASQYIVGDSTGTHAYALVSYNGSLSNPFEVYNPWGATSAGWAQSTFHGHQVYGLFNANAAFLSQNFAYQTFGVGAEADSGRTEFAQDTTRTDEHHANLAQDPFTMTTAGAAHLAMDALNLDSWMDDLALAITANPMPETAGGDAL